MREHPILFKTEMVQAILDDRKTQTRRVIALSNSIIGEGGDWDKFCWDGSAIHKDTCRHGHTDILKAPMPFADGIKLHVPYNYEEDCTIYRIYPKWDIGDRLWVKETWDSDCTCGSPDCNGVIYKAGYEGKIIPDKWRPSLFMPRKYSRITLEITDIKAQRLQNITNDDIVREGSYTLGQGNKYYSELWDSINKKNGHGWDKNDWVWVITFKNISKGL